MTAHNSKEPVSELVQRRFHQHFMSKVCPYISSTPVGLLVLEADKVRLAGDGGSEEVIRVTALLGAAQITTAPPCKGPGSLISLCDRLWTHYCLLKVDPLFTMTTEETGGSVESFLVGKEKDLVQAKRTTITVGDRDILVIYHQGTFYAMDHHCYHAGGSLLNGDIEEIDSKLCIVCPKHKYKISLEEGEGLYKATNPREKTQPARWRSKGIKQRVHKVTEQDGDVFVTLSRIPGWIESDYYQTEKGREELKKTQDEDTATGSKC
ncbi:Rieske domain-containing protein [Brachyhypopomus gauderio]|uniref:Rieske domain-containing protein n=1 Tax=Brachyhypopomus gauderio TaxID=698409 RepID=UPI004042C3C9